MTETEQFIDDHTNDDVQKLALQALRYPTINMAFALRQIAARQKIKSKLPLFFNHISLRYPVQLSIEQSSSEITALYKSNLCEGDSMVDLTGGFGVDCSFMSQNFKQVTYVERNTELCELAKHNFEVLGLKNIEICNADAIEYLCQMASVDVIFIDPARRSSTGKKVFKLSDCEPNIAINFELLLSKSNKILVKLSPMLDLTQVRNELKQINEIHIISVENECKEILLVIEKNKKENTQIKTINYDKKAIQKFDFEADNEFDSISTLTDTAKKYLYEPNASIMKSGAFKTIGERYRLEKLHTHTHLYTSDNLLTNFPGRTFEIVEIFGNSKSDIKLLKNKLNKANISTRNYPISVNEFRKKTGITDGGEAYLFACKINNDALVILQCKKVKFDN
jgi:16S rRNA G966 N2-methylase RsmD